MRVPTVALVAVATVAVAVAAVFATLYVARAPEERVVVQKPCGERIFGHIASLARKSGRYEMRFDPAWFTSGVTANTAAAEDGVVEPGEPVPNDNYRIDEGHRLLTYLVSPTAHVTVLTRNGDRRGSARPPSRSRSSRSSFAARSPWSSSSRSTPACGSASATTRRARSTSSTSRMRRLAPGARDRSSAGP